MAVLKSINDFPDNAMDVLQDIDDYKKFCRENKLPFREHHLYKAYTPWKIFYNGKTILPWIFFYHGTNI